MSKIFSIDAENNVMAHASFDAVDANAPNAGMFETERELQSLVKDWPTSRLIEIWNSIPGQKPVKSFQSRKTAVRRIWKAIQSLGPDIAPSAAKSKKTVRSAPVPVTKPTVAAPAPTSAKTPRSDTRHSTILGLLRQPGGVSLEKIASVTGWQRHSVRGFIAGTGKKKLGLNIESFKNEAGERAYRII